MRGLERLLLLLITLLFGSHVGAVGRAEPAADVPQLCQQQLDQDSVLQVTSNCTLRSAVAARPRLSIMGARPSLGAYSSKSATPCIYGAPPTKPAAATGVKLQLERLILVGFEFAAPTSGLLQPLLWPTGLVAGSGEYLNMTDVRVVISSQALFNKYLEFFTNQDTMFWTDNTNFIHIQQWADGRTQLRSVGVLMTAPGSEQAPALPLIRNCLLSATNTTLLPAMVPHAAVATPLPLLVYLTSNVTLGSSPPLPATGVAIKRPVVFVGLQSVATSINFQMVVNQLNLSASPYANATFVGLVLENLGPGDSVTSAVASPFSIAITNNMWPVYYNRSVPNKVRWALYNVTMVLPQDSEMSYVTYMFTLYSSPLQYFKEQTQFYSAVLHMSMLQFAPGPGNHAIIVMHLFSWFHRWGYVILTTQPQVAQSLSMPSRPLVPLSSATRLSPLVQAVRTADELRMYSETPVIGDREHILLFLSNVSVPALTPSGSTTGSNSSSKPGAAEPMQIASAMTWVGYNAASSSSSSSSSTAGAVRQLLADAGGGGREPQGVFLDCNYQRSAVVIPSSLPKDALKLQQLVLVGLPQGPDAAVPSQLKAVPSSLFTVMLWSFQRPADMRSIHLVGVTLVLPDPELDYFKSYAQATNDFVVEVAGSILKTSSPGGVRSDALTFENAFQQGDDLQVESLTGPGFLASNVTLRGYADAATAMPGGYQWPDPSQLRLPASATAHPRWVMAVVAVCVTLAVLLVALACFMWWQRKRICASDTEAGPLFALEGSTSFSKVGSRSSCQRHSPSSNSRHGSMGAADHGSKTSIICSQHTSCSTCAAAGHVHHNDSSSTDVHARGLGSSTSSRHSPHPDGKDGLIGVVAGAGVAGAAAAAAAGAGAAAGASWSDRPSPAGSAGQVKDVTSQRDAPLTASTAALDSTASLQDNVAAGMQRWRTAVSSTTMLLMERRMDAAAALAPASPAGSTTASHAPTGVPPGNAEGAPQQPAGPQGEAGDAERTGSDSTQQQQLQLLELLGQGSFGSVFLAVWRGKRVAVKVMQLPASALLDPDEQLGAEHPSTQQQQQHQQQQPPEVAAQERRRRLQRQRQQNSPPHMAIMEAVLSSAMSHPNVVQVFTYMLSPLTSSSRPADADGADGGKAPAATAGNHAPVTRGGSSNGQDIAGWSLKLVMEFCDEGSLRDALDCGLLSRPGGFLAPAAVLALAHDVASAMLHLHSEGIVHGDLKAGNVMLTSSGGSNVNGLPGVRIWSAGGDRTLTAKVGDFGLAMPLAPRDTHATLLARGTPSHMSPELFISGHVSKASDVYAFGVLLFEIITGRRAYAGVPIPLLPHEVAMQGLRPEWPHGLPPGCRDLRKLAEACWVHKPQDRPTFNEILQTLDIWSAGGHGWPAVPLGNRTIRPRQQQQQQQPPQQQQQEQRQEQEQQTPQAGPQQQQQHNPTGAAAAPSSVPPQRTTSGQAAGEARNRHMSWSEVDCNDGSHPSCS